MNRKVEVLRLVMAVDLKVESGLAQNDKTAKQKEKEEKKKAEKAAKLEKLRQKQLKLGEQKKSTEEQTKSRRKMVKVSRNPSWEKRLSQLQSTRKVERNQGK